MSDSQNSNNHGNVTLGEAQRFLIDIIGENVILDLMGNKYRIANKQNFLRMNKGKVNPNKFSNDRKNIKDSIEQFFKKELEENYGFSPLALKIINYITRLFSNLHTWHTPFEKSKQENSRLLFQNHVLNFIYDLTEGIRFDDDTYYKTSKESIKEFFTDNYETIFLEVRKSSYNNDIIKNYKQNICNWSNGSVYNANWNTLAPVLDSLNKKDNTNLVHRLIKLYLRKNAQKAIEKILHITQNEQENMTAKIIAMLDENIKPENKFCENNTLICKEDVLIYECLLNQQAGYFGHELIKNIENECHNSKIFFSPWLKARAKVIQKGENLKNDDKTKDEIINGYRKAYDEGMAHAGNFLRQFVIEAITINRYCNKRKEGDTNNYFGYGDALELFKKEKKEIISGIDYYMKNISNPCEYFNYIFSAALEFEKLRPNPI